jgi:putative ABC transport system substrate-binding protein
MHRPWGAGMRRRKFLSVLGGVATLPLAARAQQPGSLRKFAVLFAQAETDPESQQRAAVVKRTLQELGWIEGRNIRLEFRWFSNEPESARRLAKELVALSPDAILVQSTPGVEAVRAATKTIPTVFVVVTDPVGSGVVESLARPNTNMTGFSSFEPEIGSKWLDTIKEVAPRIREVAVLLDPDFSAFTAVWKAIVSAAPGMGLQLIQAPIHTSGDIEPAIALVATKPDRALLVVPHALTTGNRDLIVRLAAQHRMPAVYPFRFFTTAGGLMSYGIDQDDLFRRGTGYIDRILKGDKPADLPVQVPSKFELAFNLKTAKTLGLTVPPKLLFTADEVIE